MRRILLVCLMLLAAQPAASFSFVPPEQRTLFHEAETAWAVGTVQLGSSLKFRNGGVLAFPSQIVDLLWAPDGTKPRNLMLVEEVPTAEMDSPFFKTGDKIFCPIRLLPEHSFWKDNLPTTRRHAVAGGRRYVFRGEEIPLVRSILEAYLQAFERSGRPRWTGEIAAVTNALNSTIAVVREDAVRYLQVYPTLARDFEDSALPSVKVYLEGGAPAAEKAVLVQSFLAAQIESLRPVLEPLATRQDATGAVALAGLASLGTVPPQDQLLTLSNSPSNEVRAFAVGELAKGVGSSEAARKRVAEVLESDETPPEVQKAAIEGLVTAANSEAVLILADQLRGGGANSRPSGEALGRISGEQSSKILMATLKDEKGEAAIAAAMGLSRSKGCVGCRPFLVEQHDKHTDPAVQQFIATVLQLPLEHKH